MNHQVRHRLEDSQVLFQQGNAVRLPVPVAASLHIDAKTGHERRHARGLRWNGACRMLSRCMCKLIQIAPDCSLFTAQGHNMLLPR